MERVVLYTEIDGTSKDIELPPTTKVNVREISTILGLPGYLDLGSFQMERTVVALWASINAPSILDGLGGKKKADSPLTPLLIGGGAVKLLSPTANDPRSPLCRRIKDVDFVIPKDQGPVFIFLLDHLSAIAGTRFHHFLTKSDVMFNAMRAGERYRLRSVEWNTEERPVVKNIDVLGERIEMRHPVDVREEFSADRSRNKFTVGPEKLLVLKSQLITDLDRKETQRLVDSGQSFRILDYPSYRSDRLLIGMEEKDVIDVAALLLDLGAGTQGIDPMRVSRAVEKDERLALTVRLNLQNLASRKDWLRAKGVEEAQLARIGAALDAILAALPPIRKAWSKPWWNTDVETPVFG